MPIESPNEPARNATVARGAGLALLGRMGAVIEIFSFFLFTQMYGSQTFGLFVTLWGMTMVLAIISDFGMTMALQRFVPQNSDSTSAGRVVKYAISVSLTMSCIIAVIVALSAPWLASIINANEQDSRFLVTIIQVYAIAIPLWCLIDVSTAAIRARQVFGPEIKVRVFYEQGFRLVFGSLFWFIGAHALFGYSSDFFLSTGLFFSHLIGLAVTVFFAARLVHKYYGLGHLFTKTGHSKGLIREMVRFSSTMMLPNLAKKWHSWLPVLFLNIMLPGASGAQAAGVYAAARKIVSVLNIFRESFEYVLAPIASATSAIEDKARLREMYAFATRIALTTFIPAAALIITMRHELLRQSGSEFVAGAGTALILALGRGVEVSFGPSSSILAMIGLYRLPFINAVTGVISTGVLAFIFIENAHWFGGDIRGAMVGAALAAAIGIALNSLMAHVEVRLIYGLMPYDKRLIRPVLTAFAIAGVLAAFLIAITDIWRTAYFILGLAAFVLALIALIRLGFTQEDARLIVPKKIGKRLPFLVQR